MPHEAKPETLLLVLAGTLASLAKQIDELPAPLRRRIKPPAPSRLRALHARVVAVRAEITQPNAPDSPDGERVQGSLA